MSDWLAQDGENRKYRVQRPKNKGQTGRVVQPQRVAVWHPDSFGNRSQWRGWAVGGAAGNPGCFAGAEG